MFITQRNGLSFFLRFPLVLCLLITGFVQAQKEANKTIYKAFDSIVSYQNSGIYFGKPNTPYPNIDWDNHPFFDGLDYQNASLIYKNQPYHEVQIRYDVVKEEIQILPNKKFNLLGITLFSEFISEFTIGDFRFKSLNNPENGDKFYQVLLENSTFMLLKHYSKKEKERLKSRNVLYTEYVPNTSLHILFNGSLTRIKSKKRLLTLFPDDKDTINSLFRDKVSKKASKEDALVSVLDAWQAILLNPKSQE